MRRGELLGVSYGDLLRHTVCGVNMKVWRASPHDMEGECTEVSAYDCTYVNPHCNLLWINYTVSTKSVCVWLCGDERPVKSVPNLNFNGARQEHRVRPVTHYIAL